MSVSHANDAQPPVPARLTTEPAHFCDNALADLRGHDARSGDKMYQYALQMYLSDVGPLLYPDRWVFRVFAAGFIASLLMGCASLGPQSAYSTPFHTYTPLPLRAALHITPGTKTIKLVVGARAEIMALCGALSKRPAMACAAQQADGSWTVYAVLPAGWNDHIAISTLGHEMLHVFGGGHE